MLSAWKGIRPLARDPHASGHHGIPASHHHYHVKTHETTSYPCFLTLSNRNVRVYSICAGKSGEVEGATSTASASRDHVISHDPVTGLVFASGGKWTTYREMAEDAVDKAIEVGSLHYSRECRTLDIGLVGKEGNTP